MPYAEAVRRRFATDWATSPIAAPAFLGTRTLRDFPLAEIVPYIDWSPFFMAWELTGKYPADPHGPEVGEEARKLFDDATALARSDRRGEVADARSASTASSRPTADGDDIVLFDDESRVERAGAVFRCCGSNGSAKARRRSAAWPTTSRRWTRARSIISAPSP